MHNEHFSPGKDASRQAKLATRDSDIEERSWLNPVDNLGAVHVPTAAY